MKDDLILEHAAVELGGRPILRDIDLHLPPGHCLALLGPSGCGKTTLLQLISGVIALGKGRLRRGDVVLDEPSTKTFIPMEKRGFAMVFQDFSLWPHMSVGENVAFGLRVRGLARAERDEKVRKALSSVKMLEAIDRRPATLSGGQQQRVAIARALAVSPPLLLLDEPLSALDAKLREELKVELKLILLENRQTSVYVTHDQAEAYALGDQVALMREGRIEQSGAPAAIYHQPCSRYVAEFLGAANVMPYHQREGLFHAGPLPPLPFRPGVPASGLCFLRRERLRFEGVSAPDACSGSCVAHHFLGGTFQTHARFADGREIVGIGDVGLRVGDSVRAIFDPADVGILPENSP